MPLCTSYLKSHTFMYAYTIVLFLDSDDDEVPQREYLHASMHFMHGYFACECVWKMHFVLHPRLKTGPGRAGVSRGETIALLVSRSIVMQYLAIIESCPFCEAQRGQWNFKWLSELLLEILIKFIGTVLGLNKDIN